LGGEFEKLGEPACRRAGVEGKLERVEGLMK